MQVVVLAGGLATRMRPATLLVPKSMLVVGGRPFIDWQLEKLARCGFDEVILCIAHLGRLIFEHVKGGERFGLRVRYSDERPSPLGTAGALRKALPMLESEFLVTYGDSYLPFDYATPLLELRNNSDCDGVMSLFKNDKKWDASNAKTDGEWVLEYEKGASGTPFEWIDYGAMALRRGVIAGMLPQVALGLEVIQTQIVREKRMRALIARERFYEIGSPAGLVELEKALVSGNLESR